MKFNLIAYKDNIEDKFNSIKIDKNGVSLELSKEECEIFFKTIKGKLGVISEFKYKDSYSPHNSVLFSCDKPFNAVSYPDED
jgi:hypothetical protein